MTSEYREDALLRNFRCLSDGAQLNVLITVVRAAARAAYGLKDKTEKRRGNAKVIVLFPPPAA